MSALIVSGVAAVGLAAGGFAYAANWPTSQIFGRTIVAGDDPNEIALTYDDGPNPAATPELLAVLAKHRVRATFFLIGRFVQEQPLLARQIAAEGHAIGCHTMTHPKLTLLPEARIRGEIGDSQKAVEDAIGAPVRLFRPPHGARRPAVMRVARELGMSTVMWNCIVGDWNPVSAETLLGRIESRVARNREAGQGSSVVLHDGGHLGLGASRLESVKATDLLIQRILGTKWVTPERWVRG
ncbi:polysaccharide deacetylase family protein [Granulicella sp. WH15]|uniref:polysaccharide deacetylase family protein n=1 Tax=Granulicella sp. WH15 TaxID=2602070 RepID=UPI0013677EC5|nr:polysaccharide deacetylase family protein [Granulicella sp. WH15]QHN02139.1 polysaccharide deacetylase family protein [Granulicella sp. WH15]